MKRTILTLFLATIILPLASMIYSRSLCFAAEGISQSTGAAVLGNTPNAGLSSKAKHSQGVSFLIGTIFKGNSPDQIKNSGGEMVDHDGENTDYSLNTGAYLGQIVVWTAKVKSRDASGNISDWIVTDIVAMPPIRGDYSNESDCTWKSGDSAGQHSAGAVGLRNSEGYLRAFQVNIENGKLRRLTSDDVECRAEGGDSD